MDFDKPIPGPPGTERKIKHQQSSVNEVEAPYKADSLYKGKAGQLRSTWLSETLYH